MATYPADKNRVLNNHYSSSANFYESDLMLQDFLRRKLSAEAYESVEGRLEQMGETAAREMDALSLKADRQSPRLHKRDAWGEAVDHIEFHPAYHRLMEIAAESGMFTVKWSPAWRQRYPDERHLLSFGISSLYGLAETGVYCPLCMTDGAAVLIDRFCDEADKARLLPAVYASSLEEMKTGAMYLTEKAGGSDVGATLAVAEHWEGKTYALTGEKWFCSNADGDIAFVLARTHSDDTRPDKTSPDNRRTAGLSIFLVEKALPDGKRNPMDIIRLKDKLGVRSMASAEIMLQKTRGTLVGEEGQGFKIMTAMINLSRVYNSMAAHSASKRALMEAYQFLRGRDTFGRNALDHPLVRKKLEELGALNTACFYLVWRAVEALDSEDEKESSLLRLLTPMAKKWSAEIGVYLTREAMELTGGIGYIEDHIMPRLMRDVMVLPIWEGAGNIMLLDMLRASGKSEGLAVMLEHIARSVSDPVHGSWVKRESEALRAYSKELFAMESEAMQYNAPAFFNRLTRLFQMSVMIEARDGANERWIDPALRVLRRQGEGETLAPEAVPSREVIEDMLAWKA
ncbi:acyl-CoA dehydrogenase family protein [Halomonas piscis]|uniref:Acyl-CoA dehydrogenase family protein n=1 Tax=Halomonas piscis TaxID=3031727 RepID=A0ABY9Z1I5_9GAMM|nr:acyl-CoA dehydrogenase family protein [Halomonas piscis]WNK20987.1 acyl-CoA dehydrogenase family protein [Halomonas piscis]